MRYTTFEFNDFWRCIILWETMNIWTTTKFYYQNRTTPSMSSEVQRLWIRWWSDTIADCDESDSCIEERFMMSCPIYRVQTAWRIEKGALFIRIIYAFDGYSQSYWRRLQYDWNLLGIRRSSILELFSCKSRSRTWREPLTRVGCSRGGFDQLKQVYEPVIMETPSTGMAEW
jgi:hypothetical protein